MTSPLRIGTRGSRLALWQATFVAERLRPLAGPRTVSLVEIETGGDRDRDRPLAQIGGEGVFTKEIQQALLAGTVDVAVHSLKDLPTLAVAGLVLAAVPPRGPTGEALVSIGHASFSVLPAGAVLATSSIRRRAQLLARRPDLRIVPIRGNVETRLRKLEDRALDGVILAQAGLERLDLGHLITEILDPAWMLPAVGQGALGLECRADDLASRQLLEKVTDPPTWFAVLAERAFLRRLGGGCQVPIGATARIHGDALSLRGAVLDAEGKHCVNGEARGLTRLAEDVGTVLADQLLARGAKELLAQRCPGA